MKLLFISLFLSSMSYAAPTKTFYVKVVGDQEMGTRLLEKLQEKDCHTFGNDCHEFKKFASNSQIKGDFSKTGSSLLYQINVSKRGGVDRFNLQIFQKEGKTLRRVRNSGNFTPQEFKLGQNKTLSKEELLNHLFDKTLEVSFK